MPANEDHALVVGTQQRRVLFGMADRRRSFEPLLDAISDDYGGIDQNDNNEANNADLSELNVPKVSHEVKALLRSAVPLTITFLLEFSLTVALVFAVGHLGDDYLAAVLVLSMTANITGYALVAGVATCLDTLCAQAFGKGNVSLVGVVFVRCTLFLLALLVPIIILWTNSEAILVAIMGEDKRQVCWLAARYLKVVLVGLPGFILFENGKHFLQAQGIFHATTYILLVCAPINVWLTYTLVWHPQMGLGFIGAPWAVVITNWAMCGLTYAYILWVDGFQCWPQYPLTDPIYWQRWRRVLDLAIPGIVMVEAEWLAFEIITFTAAQFGTQVLAAQTILLTTCILLYQVPFAIGIAATTRIAWYIGGNRPHAAKVAANATLGALGGLGVINATILYHWRRWFAQLYTLDPEVIDIALGAMAIAAWYQLLDYLLCATGGILKGQGRQKILGYINLACFYGVALPLAHWLGFARGLGLNGLWMGMVVGLYAIAGLQYYYVKRLNWPRIAATVHC